ncbi:Vi polysaccharide biosynthesis UDP-N-acetylglucosamine C-6 dehydrogenase TviB [Candidatus Puniceispirillum sp.]|uniref:Vi polysaccharide biosynthesis UDP-N-acetylglucosamine C-6 dehydrogenase TviB n=1 Tax=Candidatus Puniceispirillum sp. TaxID=2026719 RepID=UPI003F6A24BA
MTITNVNDIKLAVIGLGYVGLPLAAEFATSREVAGFDIDENRIAELKGGNDRTRELDAAELEAATGLRFTNDADDLKDCNCYIITVPTPVDAAKTPDMSALLSASKLVGSLLKAGDIVIYESTVYPGATEDDCAPVLAQQSGLSYAANAVDSDDVFHLGYSPERINPGDKQHRVTDIVKVTSGSSPDIADLIDDLYAGIITAGTYKAESIRVAEAAKVIENTQRDVNIALINELAVIFDKLDIDTEAVLKAAGTKWNFLPFRPGLVGGHCIGVDPYYLTHKAQQVGYNPEIILAGRRLNDGMSQHVADRLVQAMQNKNINVSDARVLVLGLTFKENCPDTRNSKVFDLVQHLADYKCVVDVHDPWVVVGDVPAGLAGNCIEQPMQGAYDAVIIAVGHSQFATLGAHAIRSYGKENHVLFDMKYMLDARESDARL